MEQVTRKAAMRAPVSKPPFALECIDHILLLVDGMKPAVQFYADVLGCTIEVRCPNMACCNCAPARR